jgi:hypothetical protein
MAGEQIDTYEWSRRLTATIEFFSRIKKDTRLSDERYIIQHISLYRRFIPLVAEHGSGRIWLPDVVMWLFVVHAVHARYYYHDCIRWYGKLLHFNISANQINDSFTQKLFYARYGYQICEHEDIILDFDKNFFKPGIDLSASAVKLFKFDLSKHARTVVGDLEVAVADYYKFLQLTKSVHLKKSNVLVPTGPIFLVWISHLMSTTEYISFMIEYFGGVVDCMDEIGDMHELLDNSARLWLERYQQEYGSLLESNTWSKVKSKLKVVNSLLPEIVPKKKKKKKLEAKYEYHEEEVKDHVDPVPAVKRVPEVYFCSRYFDSIVKKTNKRCGGGFSNNKDKYTF